MIIKIDIDDGIIYEDGLYASRLLMDAHNHCGDCSLNLNTLHLNAKITHKSKAGNIFIHVSNAKIRRICKEVK